MQSFLLQSLTGKLFKFNMHTKPVKNMKGTKLFDYISNAIEKTLHSSFDLVAAIFDGGTSNRKCVCLLLESDEIQYIVTKLPISFMKNNKHIFIIFCIIYIIKCMQNNLISSNNFFHYLSLILSNGEILESGYCDFKWICKLYHKYKDELIQDVKISRKSAYPTNLEKQKVESALMIFSDYITSAIKLKFREEAKGTYSFLLFINNHIMKLFVTVSCKKSFRKRDNVCILFGNPFDK